MPELTPVPPGFPIVEILGRKLICKFDFLAKYQMSVLGIRTADFRAFSRPEKPEDMDPRAMALAMKLFSCAVASNFIDKDNPGAPAQIPSPEYWAAVIPDEKWGDVCTATMQAMLKVAPPATALALVETDGAQPLN
jgi:hypothetical protein